MPSPWKALVNRQKPSNYRDKQKARQEPSSSSSSDSEEWDKDTASVASHASADLYAKRPNRWRGPPSSWRQLTEPERTLSASLDSIQDADLARHLFCAYTLRRRRRRPVAGEGEGEEGEGDATAEWEPPRVWTAWPLPVQQVPVDDFMGDARRRPTGYSVDGKEAEEDEDGELIYRCRRRRRDLEHALPGTEELEDELMATMMRVAKTRLGRRKRKWAAEEETEESGNGDGDAEDDSDDDVQREDEDGSVEEIDNDSEQARAVDILSTTSTSSMSLESSLPPAHATAASTTASAAAYPRRRRGGHPPAKARSRRSSPPLSSLIPTTVGTFNPVPLADNDAASNLLRPSARRILGKLDATLTVLHRLRVAASGAAGRSGTDVATDVDNSDVSTAVVSRRSSRARAMSSSRDEARSSTVGGVSSAAAAIIESGDGGQGEPVAVKRPRGRPKKDPNVVHVPQPPAERGKRQSRVVPIVRLPGETERDMLVRIARAKKRKIPVWSGEDPRRTGDEQEGKRTGKRKGRHRTSVVREWRAGMGESGFEASGESESGSHVSEAPRHRRMRSRSDTAASPRNTDNDDEDQDGDRSQPERRPLSRASSSFSLRSQASVSATYSSRAKGGGQRDWSEVLGAAALAGFEPAVIERAARRCADLFGEGMDWLTLREGMGPASGDAMRYQMDTQKGKGKSKENEMEEVMWTTEPGITTRPDVIAKSEREEKDATAQLGLLRRRVLARRRGTAASASSVQVATANATESSTSRSAVASGLTTTAQTLTSPTKASSNQSHKPLYCTVSTCPRATSPFTAGFSLRRHLKEVHGMEWQGNENTREGLGVGDCWDENGGDEHGARQMHGCVHVDGFLTPIVPRPGWRATRKARIRGALR